MDADTKGAYKSPGLKHGFDFIFEGEIRFGPPYYKIELDGQLIPDRIFGFHFKWHPEAKYLALQEWLTTDYGKGPLTVLTLIDLQNKKLARVSKTEKGFVIPLRFEKEFILFHKYFSGKEVKKEYEINLNEIENWEEIE